MASIALDAAILGILDICHARAVFLGMQRELTIKTSPPPHAKAANANLLFNRFVAVGQPKLKRVPYCSSTNYQKL
jgi:hypothetical protein